MNYVISQAGERVSVILPIAEYEALLRYVPEDETAYLMSSPANAARLKEAFADWKAGRNMQERELLPDEADNHA